MKSRFVVAGSLLLALVASSVACAQSSKDQLASRDQERSKAEVFPASTIGYVEIQPPSKVVNLLLNHPLRDRIESIPQVKQGLKSKEFAAFLAGVGFAQFYTGMEWEESLDTLAGQGIAIGFDPKQNAVGGVFVTAHPDKLPKLFRGLLKLANQNEQTKVNEGEYRDNKAYAVGKQLFLVMLNDRVLVSNKKAMVKQMADSWLDSDSKSLASTKGFQESRETAGNKTVWSWGNLKAIRDAGLAKELFREKTENIGAELIVGGFLEATRTANEVSASFDLREDGLKLSVQTSLDTAKVPIHRSYFFGSTEERKEFEKLELDNTLAEIVAFRDLGKLWLSKEELFEEAHLAELSQADSTLSTLFSGLDFGEDVLGSTLPGFQIISRNQDYSKLETPKPDIRIPEFAFVFRLKPGNENVKRRFRVSYQSFIGFLNIQLAQQGQPQLEVESEKVGKSRIVSATYLPDEGKQYQGVINYNFSPSLAFADQWFIVSSTRKLATDLAEAGLKKSVANDPKTNTSVVVHGKKVKQILEQNSEQLIAQNMLEEGNDREEAKEQIDLLLQVIGLLRQASMNVEVEDGQLRMDLGLQIENK